jgi:transposase
VASVEIDIDLPPGVHLRGYERIDGGHTFEVDWPLPQQITCERCQHGEVAAIRIKEQTFYVIRDLDLWGQPSFFVYQPPFHQCSRCGRRQEVLPPFKRKHVTYTLRFEEQVIRLLIGSTQEEVARRLGSSAEMVATIVEHQLAQEQQIDPQRQITDVGLDEISLKKGHKLYATVLTDLTDPTRPRVLAVAAGKDQAAAEKCLDQLTAAQRDGVRSHRTDMSPAFTAAGAAKLRHSRQVIDRFHVAKKLGEVVDRVRKKRPAPIKSASPPKDANSSAANCGPSAADPRN